MMQLKKMVLDTDRTAEEILNNWHHDENTVIFWRASTNFVYRFKYNNKMYFLRFSHEDESSIERITSELDFVLYLNKNSYSVACSVKSINGRYIETVETEIGTCYAVVFEAVKGKNLDITEMSTEQLEIWGKSLAELHNLSKKYKPKNYIRNSWKDQLEYVKSILEDFPEEKSAVNELQRVYEWLNSMPISNENFGLIHYDFQLDNVFWNDSSSSFNIIDFDDSIYHWYMMDIVRALELDELEDGKSKIILKSFLKGYCSVEKIEGEYIELIPKFRRYDNLLSFAILMRSMKDSDFVKDPDWLAKLRPRLIAWCDDYRREFAKPW
ncbi:phosphotransferase enzyme family protein [Clostridium sp. Marseille-Q7071]